MAGPLEGHVVNNDELMRFLWHSGWKDCIRLDHQSDVNPHPVEVCRDINYAQIIV